MTNLSGKTIGIIGAGVSGLVSAVNMYKVGIQPIVFDKASDIGGMWNADLKPCWNSMQTNISKFSTALADFSWPKEAPIFPSQREVYQHLSNYVQQSLPKDVFRLNTQVINVNHSNDKWTIEYRTKSNDVSSEQFDFVIIASGIFDSPHMPENLTGLSSFQGTLLHSCDYRSPEQVRGRRVIVAGASMSAAQIAGDMATSAEHIIHIVPHCFWSVPTFRPLIPTDPASTFLPIDLATFRRSKRISHHENVLLNADANRKVNEVFRLITGNSQKSSKLSDANDEKPAFLAIVDMYAEWTRAEKISLKQGRLIKVEIDGT
jgi:cation diffusion facilitator CzcD-associated flavoprotein CzcO